MTALIATRRENAVEREKRVAELEAEVERLLDLNVAMLDTIAELQAANRELDGHWNAVVDKLAEMATETAYKSAATCKTCGRNTCLTQDLSDSGEDVKKFWCNRWRGK